MSDINKLRDLRDAQGFHGNWNFDPYMHGLYNGLELALATLENREPVYKSAPDRWLADIPTPPAAEPTIGEQA
jgi:hypothetical protein